MRPRLAFFLLFLGVMLGALIFWPHAGSDKLTLPNGSTLELREVTYGTCSR